ncbi:hypothetical protein [Bacillus licheniformis]|uniref:hypothetical protein n=1 Tax=Bacillus licheniformis TaxID=1402 RepID=UPI00237D1AB2|nr:hypothetical protein [Bacillus licheniformis]MDE1381234.1 hypothetical protein [Bacillus licheniformis]
MNTLDPTKLSESELKDLYFESCLCDENDNVLFEVEEFSDWHDGGKYSDAEVVFKDVKTEKYYSYSLTRSGSYFTSYEYEVWDRPVEVKKVEKQITIEEWVTV